jgi:ATP-dependent Clp protease adapter protein ClpS
MRNTHCLIILNDNQHTEEHFRSVLSLLFPHYKSSLIIGICKLIHLEGSAECAIGALERIEFCQERLNNYGIQSKIESRIL